MKACGLKKAIVEFGGTNIELHKGYHDQYGFFEKEGQLFYVSSGDDRMLRPDGQLNVMYRTAKHRKDWTGGFNQWDFIRRVNERGFKVTKFPATKERC